MSVEPSNTNSSRPPSIQSAQTNPEHESTPSYPFARSRVKNAQTLTVSEDISSYEVPVPLAADDDADIGRDLFEKRDSTDSGPDINEEQGEDDGEPDEPVDLPIELVSLTDRYGSYASLPLPSDSIFLFTLRFV